jgi:putative restriction endonuclease
MPKFESATELLNPGETALVVFTKGRHLTDKRDGTGSTGWWKINPQHKVDSVIVYRRMSDDQTDNDLYVGKPDSIEGPREDGRYLVRLQNFKFAGRAIVNWRKFAATHTQALRYVSRPMIEPPSATDRLADNAVVMKKPGDINRNDQQILRLTKERGTDHQARVWVLKCLQCLNIYGSNSTDAWERKCPACQKGNAGLDVPVDRDGENWTREEHIIAFQLYSRIPFGTIHMRNPKVIELAALLGRKVGSASLKLANFSRLDPVHQSRDIRGLEHGSKGEEQVWKEFKERPEALAFESARLLAKQLGQEIEEVAEIDTSDLPPPGIEREALVRLRVNQSFFRQRVLSAYGFRCCVTGLTNRRLLVASHIIPWAEDATHRLNPRNGLCLNPIHDRAFDQKLMWVEPGFTIRLSSKLCEATRDSKQTVDWLMSFDGKPLLLPRHFQPDPNFLAQHAKRRKP